MWVVLTVGVLKRKKHGRFYFRIGQIRMCEGPILSFQESLTQDKNDFAIDQLGCYLRSAM